MQVVLMRHGKTAWNLTRRVQGRRDVPLADEGRAELARRRLPPELTPDRWFASPLRRAVESARLLGAEALVTDSRLVEMDFGRWEGRSHAELAAEDPEGLRRAEALGLDMRPPEGETPREVQRRLIDFLAEIDAGDRVAAVTHKGVIRAALALASGWTMTGAPPWKIDWSAAQLFRYDSGRLELEAVNVALETACPE